MNSPISPHWTQASVVGIGSGASLGLGRFYGRLPFRRIANAIGIVGMFDWRIPRRFDSLLAILLLASLILPADRAWSAPCGQGWDHWGVQLRTNSERYTDVRDVHIIITILNRCGVAREFDLPYEPGSIWPPYVIVYRNGESLETVPHDDYSYGYTHFGPNEQVSRLVPLELLTLEGQLQSPGFGHYEVRWVTGPFGVTEEILTRFAVEPPPGLLPPRAIDPYAAVLARYFPDIAKLATEVLRPGIWQRILAAPSEPRWVDLLAGLRHDLIDPEGVFKLLERTKDIGIRREAVRALARLGVRPELEQRLHDSTDRRDKPLGEVIRDTARVLRGRDWNGDPVDVRCDARTIPGEACPLMSECCYWTETSGWVAPGVYASRLKPGPTEINIRSQHKRWTPKP